MFGEIIAILIIVLVLSLAIFYIIKSKKSGRKCMGCPDSGQCCYKKNNNCCCHDNKKEN